MTRLQRRAVLRLTIGAALFGAALSGVARAGDRHLVVTNFRGLALDGFDAVAYFANGRATKGSPRFEIQWRGATWRFSSEANQALFARWPKRYAPAFDGHCALGVALGKLRPGDPTAWDVVDGRLYVKESAQAQQIWLTDPSRYIKEGEVNWPDLIEAAL